MCLYCLRVSLGTRCSELATSSNEKAFGASSGLLEVCRERGGGKQCSTTGPFQIVCVCVCVCVCSRAKRVIKGVALRSLVSVLRALEVTFVTV